MRRIDIRERRARLSVRHHLARGCLAADVESATRDLVCLHATDPASVYLAARARVVGFEAADMDRALYDERSVVRMLGMRRTVFVVPVELVPVVQAACSDRIAVLERRRLLEIVAGSDVSAGAEVATWLAGLESDILRALAVRGEATAAELAADIPRFGAQVVVSRGKRYEAKLGVGARMLLVLAAQGLIVRARPRGTWLSSQYRWTLKESWLGSGGETGTLAESQAALVRCWLARYGPGTVADIRWWTGWTAAETKRALAAIGATEVALDEGSGFVLPDDLEPVPSPAPAATLLPALDPTPMGWTERDWYLGSHKDALFDTNGNVGPTIWWDGRIVGGWAQASDGRVLVRVLEEVGSEAVRAIDAEAHRASEWLGDMRPIPKFRTPLERELTGDPRLSPTPDEGP